MQNNEGEDSDTPGTPDTLILDEIYRSPAGRARLEGDFARLIPDNPEAQEAFHDLTVELKTSREIDRPWQQLIHVNENQETLVPEEESSDAEADDKDVHRLVWTGYYRFNLTKEFLPGQFSQYGWILGGGRKELKNEGVDIKLTTNKAKHRVRGRHARLALNEKSNALMLLVEPKEPVRLNGELIQDATRVITATRTRLQFGVLQYRFEYTGLAPVRYHDQLERLRGANLFKGTVHKALEATPTQEQITLKNYVIHPPFAFGSYGILSACVRITDGTSFAAKRVSRTSRSQSEIGNEIGVFEAVGDHMIEVINTRSILNESPIDDVYIIHAPLAEGSFEDLRLSDHAYEVRLNALAQVIRGVSHMHHNGVMHRDIKPTNLLFCGVDGQSVVADYGQSTREKESKDHGKGTVAYLAPEVIQLKKEEALKKKEAPSKPYGLKVDTWSLGIVGFELFFRPRGLSENPDLSMETIHELGLKKLEESTLTVAPALKNMLSWEAEHRPSMAEVASWSVWPTALPGSTVSRKRHDRR